MGSVMEGASVTQLLAAYRGGDRSAMDQAFSHVYEELRRAASIQLRRGYSPTLSTTSLVNETYLRLVDGAQASPTDRAHFLALAARAMRYIIIDYARRRGAAKRGGGAPHDVLEEAEIAVEDQAEQLLALDDALQALGRLDPRLVRLVECRFFTGMTEEETAEALEVSVSTVQRDWKRARAWLSEEMNGPAT
jgi:RNA polymerase sigma factor (TIGR02999 family)